MKLATGVGKHREAVELLPSVVWLHGKTSRLGPVCLQCDFQRLGRVFLAHSDSILRNSEVRTEVKLAVRADPRGAGSAIFSSA